MLRKLFLLPFAAYMASTSHAQPALELIEVASGLPDIVDIAHAGDERIFCVLQSGTIRIVQNDVVSPTPFLNITSQVVSGGERGLLGLAFDPNYADNGYFYVHYTAPGGSGITTIARYSVSDSDPNVADPTSQQIIYTYQQPANNHNGGDLDFGPDGHLYISLGDGGGAGDTQNNAQTLSNPLGALLRIDVSGGGVGYEVPEENPFFTAGGNVLPEIFAFGLRNPWRIGFDALTGDLWLGDVGQNEWEEIDFWPYGEDYNSGPNFGWRCREGLVPFNMSGCDATLESYVDPLVVHPTTGSWCSIVGGRVYRGSLYPSLYGHYIYTDYCAGLFYSLFPDGAGGWENELLLSDEFGFTVIAEGHDLELYAGNKSDGKLFRLVDPLTVSQPEEKEGPVFTMYPVPAREHLVVEGQLEGVSRIHLVDAAGRIVAEQPLNDAYGRIVLDTKSASGGVYVLTMMSDDGTIIARRLVSIAH